MILRFLSIFLIAAWLSPAYGQNPNTVIDWFKEEKTPPTDSVKKIISTKTNPSSAIAKSSLKPVNLNSIGIIPTKITGIDPDIWHKTDENDIFFRLNSLPNLKFQSAQTYLKRILISETQPPLSAPELKQSGKLYLLAKLDKLINIGALDEAETMVLQVPKMDPDIFERWIKISFLTDRISKLCNTLMNNSGLTQNLSVRIICLKNHNDWDAAALTLSTASNLEMFDQNREKLLIHYLDPNLMPIDKVSSSFVQLDEIDYFIINSSNRIPPIDTNEPQHQYMILKNSEGSRQRVRAAEQLAINKSINASSLFDIYRNTDINGSTEFWQRIIAVKNLDMTLKRNNDKSVNIAVNKAIDEMFIGNLLTLFATEYANKLSAFLNRKNWSQVDDSFALIFALNGEMPVNWKDYKGKDPYVVMAINILRSEKINANDVYDAIALVNPSLRKPIFSKNLNGYALHKRNNDYNSKGAIILKALKKSAQGVETNPEELYSSLLLFLQVEEIELAKKILTEYLIHFSMLKIQD